MLTEKFRAKVADFGFSREGPMESGATHVMTKVKGTAGYLDPEYVKTYRLTPKSDVYAFGILLVEIFTGRRPIEHNRSLDERITVRWVSVLSYILVMILMLVLFLQTRKQRNALNSFSC